MSEAAEGRDRLLAEQAGRLMQAGRVPLALAACRELLDREHDPDADGQIRICLAHALLAQGQVRDALGELDQASRSSSLSDTERAAAHAWAGFARISLGDIDGAAASEQAAAATAPATVEAAADDHVTTSIIMSTMARVAEGLSNPQIGQRLYISSRTVQTHLAHIFAKLDISACAQLAAEVTRRRSDL